MSEKKREMDKLKSMKLSEKIDYIWTYYKAWFAAFALVIFAAYMGVTMYHGRQKNILVNVAVVGGDSQNIEVFDNLEEEIKKAMGQTGKYDTVRIQANIPEDGGAVNSQTALTTLVGADAVDVLICPKEIYEDYSSQGGFKTMDEVLGADKEAYLELIHDENAIVLPNEGYVKDTFGVTYKDVYITVLVNEQHSEGAKAFLEHVLEKSYSSH